MNEVRKITVVVGFAISIAVTYFHWIGIFAGGVLAGLSAKNVKSALIYGFLFGFVVWLSFTLYMTSIGLFEKYFSMGIIFYMSLLLPISASTLSSFSGFCLTK